MLDDAEADEVGATDEPPGGEDDSAGDGDPICARVGDAATEIADGLGLA